METKEIKEAIKTNPEIVKDILPDILPTVLETDKIKEVITNKAEAIYKDKITQEVSGIHSQYDKDMLDILGEKPGTQDDGTKQKTYDKIKGLYTELKELRTTKDSISKDAEVIKLNKQIETLRTNGPGSHWEQTFKTEQQKWIEEKNTLSQKLQDNSKTLTNFKKQTDIEAGLRGFKFREDIPESARQALINTAVSTMVRNSKIEDDRVIYLDDNGAQINDSEYKPQSAKGILTSMLKDIVATEDGKGGGGAATVVHGSIETTSIEGKNVQKLVLVEGSFTTKSSFIDKAEEALLKSGFQRGTTEWDTLKDEAYVRYGVAKMPR